MKMPNTTPSAAVTKHLPAHLASKCLGALQRPVNPHRQRLLSAAAREAKVDKVKPDADKATAKTKAKAKAKTAVKKPKKAEPKVEVSEVKNNAKIMYNTAKKAFMERFLAFAIYNQSS